MCVCMHARTCAHIHATACVQKSVHLLGVALCSHCGYQGPNSVITLTQQALLPAELAH